MLRKKYYYHSGFIINRKHELFIYVQKGKLKNLIKLSNNIEKEKGIFHPLSVI